MAFRVGRVLTGTLSRTATSAELLVRAVAEDGAERLEVALRASTAAAGAAAFRSSGSAARALEKMSAPQHGGPEPATQEERLPHAAAITFWMAAALDSGQPLPGGSL